MSRIDRAVLSLAERIKEDPTRATVRDADKLARAVLLYFKERSR